MGVTIKSDNTGAFKSGLKAGIAKGLEEIGLAAEGYAKKECPVDTGNLRNSITHISDGQKKVVIGTNVEYGPYVEMGTSRQKAQPFLRPAAQNHVSKYKQILRSALES